MAVDTELCLVPYPVNVTRREGTLILNTALGVNVTATPELSSTARMLLYELYTRLGIAGSSQGGGGDRCKITLVRESVSNDNTEGAYQLSVTPDGVSIRAANDEGAFYGVQTLLQLIPLDGRVREIPCVEIQDQPRFKWRGLMLDCARYYFSKKSIFKFIDMMALHKLNVFHWHLTDDQGWRFEVKALPRLQEISAWRKETTFGHVNHRAGYDGTPHGGYYTQTDCREIVAYAAERHITVVPEIELPGHAQAAIAAYPELGCTDELLGVSCKWGVHKDVYNVGKEKVFGFLEKVLSEVADVFPSKYLHIGGDECVKDQWKANPLCQQRIAAEGLKDEEELQSYFIRRIEKHVRYLGRTLIGWDEILEGGLAENATVMSWQGTKGGIAAARARHDVVMCPMQSLYLNFYQDGPAQEPLAIGKNVLPIEKVYAYEPIPTELSAEEAKHVLGAQACLWTEYISTFPHVQYMALPRAAALAEITWSPKESRDFVSFKTRVQELCQRYKAAGWVYRPLSAPTNVQVF